MRALVAIYNPADLYPPTISAVNELAASCETVVLVTTKQANEEPPQFPANVKLVYALENMRAPRSAMAGMLRFMKFTKVLRKHLSTGFDIALTYEPHTLLSFIISNRLVIKKPLVKWYHNHDVYDNTQRKYSVGWYAVKQEKKYFTQLDVFSLPANERQQYFPMNKLKGKYFFIPNFPKRSFMQQFGRAKQSADVIRLIYQGRLSEGHGFEDIINILPQTVNGKQLKLVLKGFIDEAYLDRLRKQAVDNGVEKQLIFHGPSAYIEVPRLTASCHIGLAIHYKADIMTTTLGTSSNKTYEYAALGLPVGE